MSTPEETTVDPVEEPTNLPWSTDIIAMRDEVLLPSFAHDLYEELAPAAARDTGTGDGRGWALAHWCKAVGIMIQDIVSLSDAPSSWSDLVSVDKTPPEALGWLAQMVGIRLPQQIFADEAREIIRQQKNLKRGTPQAIREAIQWWLTGTKHVNIIERLDGDPYKIGITTWDTETPNPGRIEAILYEDGPNAIIPAGIIYEYTVTPAVMTFGDLLLSEQTFGDVNTNYTDFGDLRDSPPP